MPWFNKKVDLIIEFQGVLNFGLLSLAKHNFQNLLQWSRNDVPAEMVRRTPGYPLQAFTVIVCVCSGEGGGMSLGEKCLEIL